MRAAERRALTWAWRRWNHHDVDWTVGGKFSGKKDRIEKVYGRGNRPPGSRLDIEKAPTELIPLHKQYLSGAMDPDDLTKFADWTARAGEQFLSKPRFGRIPEIMLLGHLTHYASKDRSRQRCVATFLDNQTFWRDQWLPGFRETLAAQNVRPIVYDSLAPIRAWGHFAEGSGEVWNWWLDFTESTKLRGASAETLVAILEAIVSVDPTVDGERLLETPRFIDSLMKACWTEQALFTSDAFNSRLITRTLAAWASAGLVMPEELGEMVMGRIENKYAALPTRSLARFPTWVTRAVHGGMTKDQRLTYLSFVSRTIHAIPTGDLPAMLHALLDDGEELPLYFVATWVDSATNRLTELGPDDLLSVLSAFRHMQIRPPREFLQVLGPQVQLSMFAFNIKQLTELMRDMQSLSITPERTFAADWIRRAQVLSNFAQTPKEREALWAAHASLVAVINPEILEMENFSLPQQALQGRCDADLSGRETVAN